MQIVYHIGAHCTDEGQLLSSLRKNTQIFDEHSVAVPDPNGYRKLLTDVIVKLGDRPASLETQDVVLEKILKGTDPERVVFSFDNFLGGPARALEDGMLYSTAGEKVKNLHNLFPDQEIEFFLSLRDPATFVPAFLTKYKDIDAAKLVGQLNLEGLVWSDVVRDIRESVPDAKVTVWCNEDTPLIWPQIMHAITDIEMRVLFKGGLDIISLIMQREGLKRLRAYMGENQPVNEIQRRRILMAFLDKYAIDDEVDQTIDLPGWTDEVVELLSKSYDEDMEDIAKIPGVTFISA